MSTPYHAIYFAHELTRYGGEGIERLSRSLFDACVDLNPHQIEAAMFAIRSPISKGVILADEVGLGKTIEAGLVLCQYWAERRRKILVVCPAALRKQWELELKEKFNLTSQVLDAKTYNLAAKNGEINPFDSDKVTITSIHFASRKAGEIRTVPWDIIVIDEAHKLRNAYRPSNKMGQSIKWAIEDRRKILMTATPLQNSLLELYGLSTLIDERIFGDLPSFRTQYVNLGGDIDDLRDRLRSFCSRTLRSQVLEYIQYTKRVLITRPFEPSEQEHKLYEAISNFLKRDDTYALPARQKHLTTLIVRKLLASSARALAGTLETMRNRLVEMKNNHKPENDFIEHIIEEEEIEYDILDELVDNDDESNDQASKEQSPKIDLVKIDAEIEELNRYIQWAHSIGIETKTRALKKALEIGFNKLESMGANKKAVIFTESVRTQNYLKDFLDANGYDGKLVTFSGTNKSSEINQIYEQWINKNKDTGRVSGSRPVDIRTALIEHFRDQAEIMIATEAGAEGINLQFCSLVINFDLPWNPQRIEQRIGRCHRYGQMHDVVVINFLNKRNEADCRVYELLNDKFSLFSGVFGASDEVLGSIESGVDFEKRILEIYQQCRTSEEIEVAFSKLQKELDEKIGKKIKDTRKILLEHFDEDVHERLKVNLNGAKAQLDRVGKMFWNLTRYVLNNQAQFNDKEFYFDLEKPPDKEIKSGRYHLISKEHHNLDGAYLYRISHPLGEYVLETGKSCHASTNNVTFDITNHPVKITLVESLKGKSGWLGLQSLLIDSFEQEEYLLFSGIDDDGQPVDQETCEKLFSCNGSMNGYKEIPVPVKATLDANFNRHVDATIAKSLEKNNNHFNEARDRLEKWADDMVIAAEKELKDTKAQIKILSRQARTAVTMDEQHQLQEKIKQLEKKKRRQRQQIFDIEDEIIDKRDNLICALEKRMKQKTAVKPLFLIRWMVN